MTIEQFKRAKEIIDESKYLAIERNNIGHMFKEKPSKGMQGWFDRERAEYDKKIEILEKEFKEI